MSIKEYKIPLTGEYNKNIYICPECGEELLEENRFGNVYRHIIGFADSPNGLMAVVECPVCFTKFYFHAGKTGYMTFMGYKQ